MFYFLVEYLGNSYFRPIKCYRDNLDKALSKLIDLYITEKRKCIVEIVNDIVDFKKHGLMNDEHDLYYMKKQKKIFSIYKNNEIFLNFENYPETYKRLTRLSILYDYNKDKLHELYKKTYLNKYIIRYKYFTKKSTYIHDLYRYKKIDKYLNNTF